MNVRRRISLGAWAVVALFLVLLSLGLTGCLPPLSTDRTGANVAYACGDDSVGLGGASAAGPAVYDDGRPTVYVDIRNLRFHPGDLEVPVGTRVVFVNNDSVDHNIMQSGTRRIGAEPALFESPILSQGEEWGFVFTRPGEYPIICTVDAHQLMGMVGRIVVTAD